MKIVIGSENKTTSVTVVSLWTRRLRGQGYPHQYEISFPASQDILETLKEAYWRTNEDSRPLSKEVCSTTTGDLFILEGKYYLVASQGFHRLTGDEAVQEISLADSLDQAAWNTRCLWEENQPGVPVISRVPKLHERSMTLKSLCVYMNRTGNHIAKITGPSATANFERKYLARAELTREWKQTETVTEPGLYEIRDIVADGSTDTYIAFDGTSKGEISFDEALSLATSLDPENLKKNAEMAQKRDRQRRRVNRQRKKDLCLWMLDASQKMGQLESRTVSNDIVAIHVHLPIKVIPRGKPGWVGFRDPTLCGRASTRWARKGSPEYNVLMSKTLNQLTQSELEKISQRMCKAYDEDAMIQRVLAVIDHAEDKNFANLQQLVELTAKCDLGSFSIANDNYKKFLRLAMGQGCQLHPDQTTLLL